MRYAFLIFSVICLLSGCFGKTPDGELAYHQLGLAALCIILTIVLWREHIKIKKDPDDMGIKNNYSKLYNHGQRRTNQRRTGKSDTGK